MRRDGAKTPRIAGDGAVPLAGREQSEKRRRPGQVKPGKPTPGRRRLLGETPFQAGAAGRSETG